jgi:serine/threonine protein kinase
MVGMTVYRYRILEKLGAGGRGVVYKAEDARQRRFVGLEFLTLSNHQPRIRFQGARRKGCL